MTHKQKQFSPLQLIATAVVIFVAAAGGLYFGKYLSSSNPEPPLVEDVETFTNLQLQVGSKLPNVNVIDFHGDEIGTRQLLADGKTVFIFIDAECPPCHDKVSHWQNEVEKGNLTKEQVVAISFNDLGYLEEFLKKYGVTFGVYTDYNFEFLNQYGVDAYPLELLIDSTGMITEINSESNKFITL